MKQTAGTLLFLCIQAARDTAIIYTAETPLKAALLICLDPLGLNYYLR
jgi:hypothetical protein